jgi:hypothetical protein
MALTNYDMNFRKMVSQVLGHLFRTKLSDDTEAVKRVGWLTAMLQPLRLKHDEFLTFFNDKKYFLLWNSQTIILEHLLIEKFGAGIYITNNSSTNDALFVCDTNDLRSFIASDHDITNFIYDGTTDIVISLYDFTVNVPSALTFDSIVMRALINKYTNKKFNIVIV